MKSINKNRELLRQLSALYREPWLDPLVRREIHEMRFRRATRLALRMLQRRLEKALDGPFNPVISRKLDAIRVLLDD